MKKAALTLFIAPTLFASFAMPVLAQTNPGDGGIDNPPIVVKVELQNPFKVGDNLLSLMKSILENIVMPIGGILCVLGFIFAGFKYVTAQGNSAKLATANKALLYSAIGTAVLLGALLISTVVGNTLNSLLTP
ncbi:pilin [Candidatus Parcubacteria bacterium]|nr:pilin [Candidatus Parcubacteria bacterium]